MTFDVTCDLSLELLKGLRDGRYDMVVAMTPDGPAEGAFMTWREGLTWAGGSAPAPSEGEPVRLVCYPEGCLYRRAMLSALQREGRAFEVVYATPSQTGIEAAVTSGFGVTAIATRVLPRSLRALGHEAGLPRLADVVVGIYLAEGRDRSVVAQSLAARFADMFARASGFRDRGVRLRPMPTSPWAGRVAATRPAAAAPEHRATRRRRIERWKASEAASRPP